MYQTEQWQTPPNDAHWCAYSLSRKGERCLYWGKDYDETVWAAYYLAEQFGEPFFVSNRLSRAQREAVVRPGESCPIS